VSQNKTNQKATKETTKKKKKRTTEMVKHFKKKGKVSKSPDTIKEDGVC